MLSEQQLSNLSKENRHLFTQIINKNQPIIPLSSQASSYRNTISHYDSKINRSKSRKPIFETEKSLINQRSRTIQKTKSIQRSQTRVQSKRQLMSQMTREPEKIESKLHENFQHKNYKPSNGLLTPLQLAIKVDNLRKNKK